MHSPADDACVNLLLRFQIELESGEAKGGYALIPFVRDIVPEVDLDEGTMVLDPPAGLLELARPPKKAGTGGKKKVGFSHSAHQ